MRVIKPVRVSRSYTQHLIGTPEEVFPLLCPVREAEWIEGWNPVFVASESGVAESGCVFTTAASPTDSIWFITRHEPDAGFVEMLKVTPSVTACRLRISVSPVPSGSEATVVYEHTSLGAEGDKLVSEFTEAYYEKFMQDWETRMNHFLRTGQRLRADA